MAKLYVSAAFLILLFTGCVSNTQRRPTDTPSPLNNVVPGTATPDSNIVVDVPDGKYGTRCQLGGHDPTPPSYLVSDIGKPGVPALLPDQAALIHRLAKYVQSKTLRFVLVNYDPFIIVYDVGNGYVCSAGPTTVYNYSGNIAYSPATGDVDLNGHMITTPGPWMTPQSQCTTRESTVPVNSGCTYEMPAPIWGSGNCAVPAKYYASFTPTLPPSNTSIYGTLASSDSGFTFVRTRQGDVRVYLIVKPMVVGSGAACAHALQPIVANTFLFGDRTTPEPTSVPVGRYGIACRSYQEPDVVGEASYLVRDIGKVGVPKLNAEQIATIKRIGQYVKSPTLRFAMIDDRTGGIIVFDATKGLCTNESYWVLNDPSRNVFYEPSEGYLNPTPGDVMPTPGPWMTKSPM